MDAEAWDGSEDLRVLNTRIDLAGPIDVEGIGVDGVEAEYG